MNIEKKMLEAVITNTGERFKLSSQTIIVGLNGRQVSIRKMRVPCDAEISFQVENGVRVAQRIKMLQIGKDSSWHWTSDKPD